MFESLEEGPARQKTDALVGVDCAIGNGLLVHSCKESKLDLLLLSQVICWVELVELDGCTIDLKKLWQSLTL